MTVRTRMLAGSFFAACTFICVLPSLAVEKGVNPPPLEVRRAFDNLEATVTDELTSVEHALTNHTEALKRLLGKVEMSQHLALRQAKLQDLIDSLLRQLDLQFPFVVTSDGKVTIASRGSPVTSRARTDSLLEQRIQESSAAYFPGARIKTGMDYRLARISHQLPAASP